MNIPRAPKTQRSISLNTQSTGVGGEGNFSEEGTELFFVSTYSDFEKLAHGPRGTEARQSIYVYRFHPNDGSMVLCNRFGDPKEVLNPAFTRHHPRLNVVYTCTEDIEENGKIFAYRLECDGGLTKLGCVDAGGTSTCYLTIDKAQKNMLAVNYWNSTLSVLPLDSETGNFTGGIHSMYDPKEGKEMVAAAKKNGGVNHSNNDDSTIAARQADPHSHALVLDPFVGTVAYVPDLGKDLIREFYYNREGAKIELELNVLPSGLCTGMPDGPRYFVFHPDFNVAYVINELSSTVAVFSVDRALLNEIAAASKRGDVDMKAKFKGRSTLTLLQSVSCLPNAFPKHLNTCGRICVHKSGRFVIVSNRGHESIAIFRVKTGSRGAGRGTLHPVGHFHTRGETPRHFQFDSSGQYLIVANQDSDTIAVFNFNLSTGEIKYTGNEYRVPSPNFVCSCPFYPEDDRDATTLEDAELEQSVEQQEIESDLESEESVVHTIAQTKAMAKEALEHELGAARKEIEVLKERLAALATPTAASASD